MKLKGELEAIGAKASEADPGFYTLFTKQDMVYLIIWVDDILIASKSIKAIDNIKTALMTTFEARDLGEAKMFVGIEIDRNRKERTLKISQRRMALDLVAKYGLEEGRSRTVPLAPSIKLSKDEANPLDTTKYGYSELVGSLLYLTVCTRPDIAQAVGALTRYMSKPAESHWQAIKGVLRYVAGTASFGIVYKPEDSTLSGYADADYAGDIDTRRSTTGYVFILNGGVISWSSRLQATVAVSTAESEYMSAAAAVKEALWLRKLLSDFGKATPTVKIYGDNQAAIKLLKHPIASLRSKHIDVIYHFARERVARGEVKFEYISTDKMVADIMTKALPENKFVTCRDSMSMND
jgi:hypothetical protein